MGKLNEIQQQSTQSYGGNSFTTKIEENTVVFDSAKDNFKFNDPVDVPELTINGQPVEPGGGSTVEIQDLVEPSERAYKIATIKVDDVDNDIYMTDKYNGSLTVASGNSPLTKYVFITGGGAGNPGVTLRNGSLSTGIAQYTTDGIGIGTGKKLMFPEIEGEQTIAVKSDIVQSDWNQNDSTKADFIKNKPVIGGVTNIVNGSSVGSVIGINTVEESSTYTIGENAVALGKDTMAIGENSFAEGNGCVYEYSIEFEKTENGYRVETDYFPAVVGIKILCNNEIYTISSINVDPDDDSYLIVEFAEGGPDNNFEGYTQGYSGGTASHAEGYCTTANGENSHAEGFLTAASGTVSHAEGAGTVASGAYSHAEGQNTIASGAYSHAQGYYTIASGDRSHAEGYGTIASGAYSHAEGTNTIANHSSQHVFGEHNIEDGSSSSSSFRGNYVEIVGNGYNKYSRSNARTLDWDGNEALAGTLKIGSTSSTGGAILKVESNSLKISFDNGTTWQTVTLS